MTEKKAYALLKNYRFDKGRCAHLEIEIDRLQKAIDAEREMMIDEMAGVQSGNPTGMPKGSGTDSPTETVGIALANGKKSVEMRLLQQQLLKTKKEYDRRKYTVIFVESWLKGLLPDERIIIENQVIDGESWQMVRDRLKEYLGYEVSKTTFQRMRKKAVDKVFRLAR